MSKKRKYISHFPKETKKIAAEIIKEAWPAAAFGGAPLEAVVQKEGRALPKPLAKKGSLVLALSGELGAGKTIFAQGVGEYLGISRIINSPTFVIMKRYDISRESKTPKKFKGMHNFYHFDCYRINSSDEILELGWQDIISADGNLVLVEWAERIKDILPSDAVWIKMKSRNKSDREIIVE